MGKCTIATEWRCDHNCVEACRRATRQCCLPLMAGPIHCCCTVALLRE